MFTCLWDFATKFRYDSYPKKPFYGEFRVEWNRPHMIKFEWTALPFEMDVVDKRLHRGFIIVPKPQKMEIMKRETQKHSGAW